MQSPKRVLQVLIPPNVAVQRIQKESDVIESKMKVVIMGLEIERLHKVANIITDKYEDKLQQLETQQQLLNDKIENQDVKIGTLNQQLLLKDDFINEIFEEKCPDEVNKKLNQQLKQVTSQLNRAKKQIETLNEMNIIFKKNPPESPELADKIQQLESNYEEIIQKKDQEITNLKIRNSSYDHSHSQEISDQKSELMKLQLENQFLNEKMDELIEENEKLKQQLIQSVKQSIQSIPEYKLVTQVIQQEPFHAFTDFQLLGRNDAAQSSQVSFSQPQKTPYQNNQEIMKNLRQFEKLQTDGQFTHEKVLQQVRLCATLLHLKRMELPEDINDSNVVYLNKIEKTDSKKGSKQDLASTVKPKKLFSKHDEPVTQEKQLRSQSVRSNAIEVQKRNQFVQVDFQDYKQLEQTQQQLENLKKDYHQISKLVNAKLQKESIPKQQNQSDIQNSVESDELQKQDRKEGSSKIKDSLNKMNERLSDYSFRESQIQQNRDKINAENFKKQLENFEEQNQYLRQQNQQQQNLIKKLQEKADKNLPNDYQLSENQHLINYLQQEVSTLNQQLQEQKQNIKSKFTDNKLIQTEKAKVLHKYNQTEIDIDFQKLIDLNELNFQNQIIQMQEEMNDLKALNDHLQQEHLQLQNQIKELQIKLHGTAEEKDLLQLEMQQKLQYQLNKINLESGDNENLQDQLKQLKEQFYKLKLENVDLLEKIKIPIKSENNQDEYLNQIDQLQKLLEQTKLELQQKHLDLEQLENEHELQQKQLAELQAENQNLHQFIKDQENEYQTQMSQIRYRISVLEEQQIKEHSRSVSISDDQTKEQQTEVVINPDYEIQIRRLQDEKSVLLTELQKQIQESKQIIKDMQNEFAFQRLQLEEKIQELESKIVLYRDGDAQLMQENQNLANQITNLTNQLTLARQTSKIQSSKTLKSVTVSPREQITQQEILDLKNNVNDLQLKIISLEKENNELENLNQRLTQQLQQIKTENNFESEDNKRLKSQNQSLRDQIQVLNKQIIVIQKNFKQEIDCLNIQIQTYIQNKIIESQDKSTQLDYTIDSRIFKERDDLIYQLKKLIHKKDIEFDDLQQNLLISRQEIFKLNDHIRKLNSIRLNQQVEQQRQYQQCSLHPQRGRASSFQIVRTVSEDRGALKKVEFWQKKYETLLQENYSTKSIKQTPEFKTQYDEILNKQQLTQQELEQQQGSNLKLKQMIEQLQINILEIKQQNILQNNEQLIKKEMEIQSSRLEINQLKNNLEIAQQECQKWKNQLEVLQNQQKIEVNKETHTLEIQRLTQDMKIQQNANNEKEIQVKQYLNDINQLKYETDQLRNQVRILQSEKQELLSSKQNNIEQQNIINKLDDRCHLLLTELNMLKTEYRQLEINYKIESKQQDAQFSRFEIMHNLDIIKQELRAYQTKCQLQEQELTQLRFQIHQPLQRSSDKLKEQYQYLGEIIKELEVTKLQNENLRKQNAELTQFQNTLTKENENLKRINSPLASPRLKYDQKQQQQLYQQQQYQQQYYQQQQQQQQQQQKQEEIDELKYELDSLKRQVLNSSTQVREAETLSLQARVLTLEQKLVQEIENLKYLTQENKELRSQMEQMRSQQRIIDQQPDFNQVEKLNRDLNEKISELTQLKIKYKQALQVMQRLGMMNIQQNKV